VPLGDLSWASAALPASIPVAAPRAAPLTRNDLRDSRSSQALSLASSLNRLSSLLVIGHSSLAQQQTEEMAYVGAYVFIVMLSQAVQQPNRAMAVMARLCRLRHCGKSAAIGDTPLSLAYRAKGDHDRAIADHTEAIRLAPKYAVAYMTRALHTAQRGTTTELSPIIPRRSSSIPSSPAPTTIVDVSTALRVNAIALSPTSRRQSRLIRNSHPHSRRLG